MVSDILYLCKTAVKLIFLGFYIIYSYAFLILRLVFPPPLKSLDGEIALITGSASGIGRELAFNLAKNHPKVKLVLWDCNEVENQKVFQDLKLIGASAFNYKIDITDRTQVEETSSKVLREVGVVTILFNNAGISCIGEFFKINPSLLEKTIQVNLISNFWTLRAFVPKMIERDHGHIVTINSAASFTSLRYGSVYSAAKHGARGFIESLRSELRHHPSKPRNIKFTTVYPFFVQTPLISVLKMTLIFGASKRYLTARQVAERIVEGVQQNQESIFIPKKLEFWLRLQQAIPHRLWATVEDFFVEKIEVSQNNPSYMESLKND